MASTETMSLCLFIAGSVECVCFSICFIYHRCLNIQNAICFCSKPPRASPTALSKQIILPINLLTDRKNDRSLRPNAIDRRLDLLFLASQLHDVLFDAMRAFSLASVYCDIIRIRQRTCPTPAGIWQPVEAPIVSIVAAAPCRSEIVGGAKTVFVVGGHSPRTESEDLDEEWAQGRETSGGDSNRGLGCCPDESWNEIV